jgi:hypothetical protein
LQFEFSLTLFSSTQIRDFKNATSSDWMVVEESGQDGKICKLDGIIKRRNESNDG